jgi:hypothetical protein
LGAAEAEEGPMTNPAGIIADARDAALAPIVGVDKSARYEAVRTSQRE